MQRDNVWGTAKENMPHPTQKDRVLWLRAGGEPSWVTAHTYRTYLSKSKRDEAKALTHQGP